ncbi:TadE/TadG family type IV pilus assembly protein [Sphingomonas rubra]|uniref:Flp pilus assembly protein TadG n=1 Tax=Sphingomonas rubra TaxID=634430 RepID=A0A1I5T8P5_9SPHN|nr:TadE/TadG family type IV pilus assembly protein [Sphingomonas rubra]SFP79181.1 Flp pilus assembly protein TadG [Sphingomonas rubra]
MIRLLSAVAADRRGATIVEFAIVAPVLLLLLLGSLDLAHQLYMTSSIQGVVQKAARDSTLETSNATTAQATVDARVERAIRAVAGNAKVRIDRRFYRTFAKAAAADPESWTDTNKNKTCDAGEPYQDENNNGTWDKDGGNAGQGNANDRVVYTVSANFPRYFPFWYAGGMAQDYTIVARTVLQNQPYADQQSYAAATVRNCP